MQALRIKKFLTSSPIWQTQILAFCLLVFLGVAIPLFVQPSSRLFILHYTIPFGVDLVGPWYNLYFLPAVGGSIFILNIILSFFLYQSQRMLSLFFSIVSPIVQAILLSALYLVIKQNLS